MDHNVASYLVPSCHEAGKNIVDPLHNYISVKLDGVEKITVRIEPASKKDSLSEFPEEANILCNAEGNFGIIPCLPPSCHAKSLTVCQGVVEDHIQSKQIKDDAIDMGQFDAKDSAVLVSGNEKDTSVKCVNNKLSCRASRVVRANDDENVTITQHSPRSKQCPYRRVTPAVWFPRGKTESFLERKIRMLQENAGLNASLDETLNAANPRVSRIEREKRAAAAAARDAMEARKAALIEASWCRILKAAGIPFMPAALELQKAEKRASEAASAATALGVVLKTTPRSSRFDNEPLRFTDPNKITASLDTAFEVDKEVAAAVKVALARLNNVPDRGVMGLCSASEGFGNIMHQKSSSLATQTVDSGSLPQPDGAGFQSQAKLQVADVQPCHGFSSIISMDENSMDGQDACAMGPSVSIESSENIKLSYKMEVKSQESSDILEDNAEDNLSSLISFMLERVKGLKLDEQASLASIVATRGLSALLEGENYEQELSAQSEKGGSLGDILVKHVSKLEAEKAAAKAAVMDREGLSKGRKKPCLSSGGVPDLGTILVKHVSKLEKEKLQAKSDVKNLAPENGLSIQHLHGVMQTDGYISGTTDSSKIMPDQLHLRNEGGAVSHQDGIRYNKNESNEELLVAEADMADGVPQHAPKTDHVGLDALKPIRKYSRLEMEKRAALEEAATEQETWQRRKTKAQEAADAWGGLDLGSALKRHVSKLEQEQAAWKHAEEESKNNAASLL